MHPYWHDLGFLLSLVRVAAREQDERFVGLWVAAGAIADAPRDRVFARLESWIAAACLTAAKKPLEEEMTSRRNLKHCAKCRATLPECGAA